MTGNRVDTASESPGELDFSAIWAASLAAMASETPGLSSELYERTAAALDRALGNSARTIGEFLNWSKRGSLPPRHMALIAWFCLEKNRPQDALFLANSAFAADPTDLSIANLIEKCQAAIFGGSHAGQTGRAFCRKPFEHFEILPNGSVHLCCGAWLPKSIGNVHNEKWDVIWNSAAAQEIRESIHDGSFRHCNSHLCPIIASNTLEAAAALREQNSTLRDIIDNRKVVLDAGPIVVNLSNDKTCNLACPSCRTNHFIAKGEKRTQLFKAAKDVVLPLLKNAKTVNMTGSGDPFASSYFRYLLKEIDSPEYADLRVDLQTNGLMLDEKSWSELKLEGKVDRIVISLDASSDSTYRIVRKGGDFARLLRNLRFVAARRHENRFNHLRLDFVVQWRNFRDIPGFVAIGRALGVDRVTFQAIYNWGTFTPAQFLQESIANPEHPDFPAFLEVLRSPTLDWEGIYWGTIKQFRDFAMSSVPDLVTLREDRERLQSDLETLTADRGRIQSDLVALTAEHERLRSDLIAIMADRERLEAGLAALTMESLRAESDLADLRAKVRSLRGKVRSLLASRSWRVTAPLRAINRTVFSVPSLFRRAG